MTPFDMTSEKSIKLISKVKSGEYHYNNLDKMFMSVCQKSWKQYNVIFEEYELNSDGILAFKFFKKYIDELLYGIEYATNRKVRYIGTNDICTFIIK